MAKPFDPYHKWLGIAPKDQPPHRYRLLGIDPFEEDRSARIASLAAEVELAPDGPFSAVLGVGYAAQSREVRAHDVHAHAATAGLVRLVPGGEAGLEHQS